MRATRESFRFVCLVVVLAPPAVAVGDGQGPRVVVETLDDEMVGQLDRFDTRSGGVRLSRDTFTEASIESLLSIRFTPQRVVDRSVGVEWVSLSDGAGFSATGHTVQGERVAFELTRGRVSVPIEAIASWALSSAAHAAFTEDPATEATTDRLLVRPRTGDGLTPVDGAVLRWDSDGVEFALAGQGDPVRAPWRRIAGVRFYRPVSSKTPPYAVTLASGDRFAATEAEFDGDRLVWSTEEGVRGEAPLGAVAQIDLAADRVTPVAELSLLASEWAPHGDLTVQRGGHAFDRALDGGVIRLRRRDPRAPGAWPGVSVTHDFARGVALASRGELRFELPAGAQRVKGLVGLDPATVAAGDCEAAVLADDRVVWSGRVAGESEPARLTVDVRGARTLTLRVEYGANLDAGDRVHFANLRVIQ